MQQHTKTALQSRYYPITWEPVPCEVEWCRKPWTEVNHISPSMRGKRNNDKYNLSICCRTHHLEFHKNENEEVRAIWKDRVKRILENIEERKEQCRKYWYYL